MNDQRAARKNNGNRGFRDAFGRLTKLNMKSVEDEIAEEMSSEEERA